MFNLLKIGPNHIKFPKTRSDLGSGSGSLIIPFWGSGSGKSNGSVVQKLILGKKNNGLFGAESRILFTLWCGVEKIMCYFCVIYNTTAYTQMCVPTRPLALYHAQRAYVMCIYTYIYIYITYTYKHKQLLHVLRDVQLLLTYLTHVPATE